MNCCQLLRRHEKWATTAAVGFLCLLSCTTTFAQVAASAGSVEAAPPLVTKLQG